jgi:hypothetical protein
MEQMPSTELERLFIFMYVTPSVTKFRSIYVYPKISTVLLSSSIDTFPFKCQWNSESHYLGTDGDITCSTELYKTSGSYGCKNSYHGLLDRYFMVYAR